LDIFPDAEEDDDEDADEEESDDDAPPSNNDCFSQDYNRKIHDRSTFDKGVNRKKVYEIIIKRNPCLLIIATTLVSDDVDTTMANGVNLTAVSVVLKDALKVMGQSNMDQDHQSSLRNDDQREANQITSNQLTERHPFQKTAQRSSFMPKTTLSMADGPSMDGNERGEDRFMGGNKYQGLDYTGYLGQVPRSEETFAQSVPQFHSPYTQSQQPYQQYQPYQAHQQYEVPGNQYMGQHTQQFGQMMPMQQIQRPKAHVLFATQAPEQVFTSPPNKTNRSGPPPLNPFSPPQGVFRQPTMVAGASNHIQEETTSPLGAHGEQIGEASSSSANRSNNVFQTPNSSQGSLQARNWGSYGQEKNGDSPSPANSNRITHLEPTVNSRRGSPDDSNCGSPGPQTQNRSQLPVKRRINQNETDSGDDVVDDSPQVEKPIDDEPHSPFMNPTRNLSQRARNSNQARLERSNAEEMPQHRKGWTGMGVQDSPVGCRRSTTRTSNLSSTQSSTMTDESGSCCDDESDLTSLHGTDSGRSSGNCNY
jgi:hypothetical protein